MTRNNDILGLTTIPTEPSHQRSAVFTLAESANDANDFILLLAMVFGIEPSDLCVVCYTPLIELHCPWHDDPMDSDLPDRIIPALHREEDKP